jgi:hypothetical protein
MSSATGYIRIEERVRKIQKTRESARRSISGFYRLLSIGEARLPSGDPEESRGEGRECVASPLRNLSRGGSGAGFRAELVEALLDTRQLGFESFDLRIRRLCAALHLGRCDGWGTPGVLSDVECPGGHGRQQNRQEGVDPGTRGATLRAGLPG